jgi:hypothetical protein
MKIHEMLDGLTPPMRDRPELFTRNRPDDVVEFKLSATLRDGRTVEIELPKGVRPTVDLTIDRMPDELDFDYYKSRSFRMANDSVRIVIEADTRNGRAEDDGCLFRLAVQDSGEVTS